MKSVYTLDLTNKAVELLLEILGSDGSKRLRKKLSKARDTIFSHLETQTRLDYIIESVDFSGAEWVEIINAVLERCTMQPDGEPYPRQSPQAELFIATLNTTYAEDWSCWE